MQYRHQTNVGVTGMDALKGCLKTAATIAIEAAFAKSDLKAMKKGGKLGGHGAKKAGKEAAKEGTDAAKDRAVRDAGDAAADKARRDAGQTGTAQQKDEAAAAARKKAEKKKRKEFETEEIKREYKEKSLKNAEDLAASKLRSKKKISKAGKDAREQAAAVNPRATKQELDNAEQAGRAAEEARIRNTARADLEKEYYWDTDPNGNPVRGNTRRHSKRLKNGARSLADLIAIGPRSAGKMLTAAGAGLLEDRELEIVISLGPAGNLGFTLDVETGEFGPAEGVASGYQDPDE